MSRHLLEAVRLNMGKYEESLGVRLGDLGTVVEVYGDGVYEVEFVDQDGRGTLLVLREGEIGDYPQVFYPAPALDDGVVWIVEHRSTIEHRRDFDCTVYGVFSTVDRATAFAQCNLDTLADEKSWFHIQAQRIDADIFDANEEHLEFVGPDTCFVDRLGTVSWETQPHVPPHLLGETE